MNELREKQRVKSFRAIKAKHGEIYYAKEAISGFNLKLHNFLHFFERLLMEEETKSFTVDLNLEKIVYFDCFKLDEFKKFTKSRTVFKFYFSIKMRFAINESHMESLVHVWDILKEKSKLFIQMLENFKMSFLLALLHPTTFLKNPFSMLTATDLFILNYFQGYETFHGAFHAFTLSKRSTQV